MINFAYEFIICIFTANKCGKYGVVTVSTVNEREDISIPKSKGFVKTGKLNLNADNNSYAFAA